MLGLNRQAYRAITHIHLFFDHLFYRLRLVLRMGTNAPIIVVPYPSYGTEQYIFIQGRVLKEKRIKHVESGNAWQTLQDNFNRAWSVEIRNATLKVVVGDNEFIVQTDKEGYYKLATRLPNPLPKGNDLWRSAKITLIKVPWRATHFEVDGPFIVPKKAKFGIISDIDDTVIETRVTSILKLRMIYLAFFKSATKRNAFPHVAPFFQKLQNHRNHTNPIFFVSKSPWNIIDQIETFFEHNQIPLGPLLLRDYGLPYQNRPTNYRGHKFENIVKILNTYPGLDFILVGDSGEKDAEIYLKIAEQFPGRIKGIYIHDVRRNYRGVDGKTKDIPEILVFDSYQAAIQHAIGNHWIEQDD